MADFSTLEIWGPVLIYDASTSTWERQKRTLAQWQAAEDKEDYGLYSWDAATPPDGATKLEADAKFWIDADSAKAHGLRGKPAADDFELLVEHGITDFQDAKGCYWAEGTHGGEAAYTNGHWWIYLHSTYGWSIGQSLGSPPHFVASDGEGPQNTYLTNFDDFDDPTANPDWDQTQVVSVSEPDEAEKAAAAEAIDESNPAFNHDLTIVIDGWPLSCTSRTDSPYVMDIASIQHEPAVEILAVDDTIEDFEVVANATVPDSAGNVEVTAAGGSVKYTIPNNWIDRNTVHVPAQDGVGGAAPEGYIVMRRDVYYGHPTTPETEREGVYCWRGWRKLRVDFNAPADSQVTMTIKYYGDIVVSDNKKTDSTRQTELKITLGELTTLSRTVDVDEGPNSVLFDLAPVNSTGRLPPLHIVTEVEIAFADAGDWTMTVPQLDGVSSEIFKWFEHMAYAKGGGSAIADGVHVCALYAFDEDSPNTIERTLANFSRLIGAKTGIDMTSAWSLAQWLSLAQNCSNAWATSYSTTAAEAAFKDADDTWLKTPSVTDLQPTMGQDVSASGALSVACRVAQWTAVRGLKYDWTARKIVQGRIQGWVIGSDGEPVGDYSGASNLWRRSSSADDWTQVEALSSDAYGRFASEAREVYDWDATEETSTLFDYGIGKGISTVASTGRFADREWDAWVVLVGGTIADSWLLYLEENRMLLFFFTADSIHHIYSQPEDQYWVDASGIDVPGGTNPKYDCEGECPAAYRDIRHGQIVLGYVDADSGLEGYSSSGTVKIRCSTDFGETWGDPVSVDLGLDVAKQMIWQDPDSGLSHMVVVTAGDAIYHAMSDDNFVTLLETPNLVTTEGNSGSQACGYTQRGAGGHGILYVGFVGTDGSYKQFKSEDLGKTWAEVA